MMPNFDGKRARRPPEWNNAITPPHHSLPLESHISNIIYNAILSSLGASNSGTAIILQRSNKQQAINKTLSNLQSNIMGVISAVFLILVTLIRKHSKLFPPQDKTNKKASPTSWGVDGIRLRSRFSGEHLPDFTWVCSTPSPSLARN